tara:strand:+ start:7873 stop:8331 length:459 start_codon:yes stop_codon:yes gene_type:complete
MPDKQLVDSAARLNPAITQIAIPAPGVTGKPFAAPRMWHAAHANNLRKMMAGAGYEEISYVPAENDGRGSVITFANYAIGASPGDIPDPIQSYINEHLAGRLLESLRFFANAAAGVLDVLDDLFPQIAVVTVPVIFAINKATDLVDAAADQD